jgi:hypothetical protein
MLKVGKRLQCFRATAYYEHEKTEQHRKRQCIPYVRKIALLTNGKDGMVLNHAPPLAEDVPKPSKIDA